MLARIRGHWHVTKHIPRCWRAVRRLRGYKPQPVTLSLVLKWLCQFGWADRDAVLSLLEAVDYISERETEKRLVGLNQALLNRLQGDGIGMESVIYVQLHDPGSSSGVVLNMLRDAARLERRGCHFVDSSNVRGLNELTNQLEKGAIIFVDDFAGTGNQFCGVRDYLAEYIVGQFAEFFLLPCICEEAIYQLGKRAVEAVSGGVHSKADRPLHPNSTILGYATKARLVELCCQIDRKAGLGYKGLATMVVLYRNAPNTVPLLLRGSIRQEPWRGVLPRTTDLPWN